METLLNPVPTSQDADPPWIKDPASLQRALDDLVASPPFRNTQQCQNLLLYIVKHTVSGEDNLLRERVIGSEVFGRKADYDTGEDPVVRIRAAEVRKRLAQYYQSATDAPEFHIDIPSGSYRATFRWKEHLPAILEPPLLPQTAFLENSDAMIPEVASPGPSPRNNEVLAVRQPVTRRYVAAATCLLLLVTASAMFWSSTTVSAYSKFWRPWVSNSKPVIIAVGSNAVYRLSDAVTDRYAREHHLETQGREVFMPLGPDVTLNGSDLYPAESSFVALGDVAAVSAVVANLTRQKQTFQERFPNDISFAELRETPSVLVGGFNNPMTMELTKNLRFVMRARNQIDDTQDPNRHWLLHASSDSHDTEDYAIITRLAPRSGDAPFLSVAGMGQYGTLAAADFICNPASIAQMARTLPRDWPARNLQIILHLKVVDFKPVATEIVALHTWLPN
jgi:hypothetical protein